MSQNQFFFVHIQPSSQSRHEKELLRSRSRAHAAKAVYRKRKLQKEQLDTSAVDEVPPSVVSWSSAGSVTSSSPRSSAPSFPSPGSPKAKDEIETETETETEACEDDDDEVEEVSSKWRPSHITPGHPASIRRSEYASSQPQAIPLSLAASPFDPKYRNIISTFQRLVSPSIGVVYDIFNVRNVCNNDWIEHMADPVFFHAGAAVIEAIHDGVVTSGPRAGPPSNAILEHRGKAMAVVRKTLEEPGARAADGMLLAILFLAILEKRLGSEAAHNAHKRFLGRIAKLGGLDSVSEWVWCNFLQFESFWALDSGYTIVPDPVSAHQLIYPPFPIPFPLAYTISTFPPGIAALAYASKLSMSTLTLLSRMPPSSSHTTAIPAKGAFLPTRSQPYADFSDACPSLRTLDVPEPSVEKLLCLALMIYCANAFSPVRTWDWGRAELANKLRECEEVRDADEEECLFWIWSVTVDAYATGEGTLAGDGRGLLLAQKERFPGMTRWWEVERVLKRFYWTEDLRRSCLRYMFVDGGEVERRVT